jgi:hypothetical protein
MIKILKTFLHFMAVDEILWDETKNAEEKFRVGREKGSQHNSGVLRVVVITHHNSVDAVLVKQACRLPSFAIVEDMDHTRPSQMKEDLSI